MKNVKFVELSKNEMQDVNGGEGFFYEVGHWLGETAHSIYDGICEMFD